MRPFCIFLLGSEVAGDIYALIWHLILEIYNFIGDFENAETVLHNYIIEIITVKLHFLSKIIIVAIMKIFILF